ncbi:uncharacterized protein LOC128720455 [Anopheles nili]|uniref:uncharacterized protein LOC128720455 n=1 Tax=Anopheles nili TaxID=185578 RepID=UPI00237BDDEA|nr:uncharacterized protein LOC128720455 [Anopheles nili]
MAPLRLLVILFGVGGWESLLATASRTANDLHDVTDDRDSLRRVHRHPKDIHGRSSTTTAPMGSFETYYFEHAQTELAARQFVATLNHSELHRNPSWCKQCNATVMHYCRTQHFINDHCCCEYSHTKEQLPWIPHTCLLKLYDPCTANAGSCSKYRAIKECCCDRATKLAYKVKFSTASSVWVAQVWQLVLAVGIVCVLASVRSCPGRS